MKIFLDLTQPLPSDLIEKFDVVFNHTTLEHIFDIFFCFQKFISLNKRYIDRYSSFFTRTTCRL